MWPPLTGASPEVLRFEPDAYSLSVMCMKWNRNQIGVNVAVLLILSGICLALVPWYNQSDSCFQSQRFSGRTLILDAGHGGEDGGAVSVTGTSESQINLDIVLKMQQICGLFGVDPVLTRDRDTSLKDTSADTLAQKKRTDLRNRVKLVEKTKNAFLISVHQNYFSGASNHGAQVFFAPTEGSQAWGIYCQQLLVDQLDAENHRQSKQISDDVYLMNHITCPAILVECGFISNREEAKRLEQDDYQTQVAITIVSSYLTYDTMQSLR